MLSPILYPLHTLMQGHWHIVESCEQMKISHARVAQWKACRCSAKADDDSLSIVLSMSRDDCTCTHDGPSARKKKSIVYRLPIVLCCLHLERIFFPSWAGTRFFGFALLWLLKWKKLNGKLVPWPLFISRLTSLHLFVSSFYDTIMKLFYSWMQVCKSLEDRCLHRFPDSFHRGSQTSVNNQTCWK